MTSNREGSWSGWLVPQLRRPAPSAEPAVGPVGSLVELIEQVLRLADRRKLAGQLLATDPLYRRIRLDQRGAAVDFGLGAGERVSRELMAQWGTTDPFALAQSLGIKISFTEGKSRVGSHVRFSEYRGKPPAITIYSESMDDVNGAIRENGLGAKLGISDITPIHVAHELYHHVELQKKPPPTAGFRIPTLVVGPIRVDSGLVSLAEIAANAFAQELLGLRMYPSLLGFVTVYLHNAQLAWAMADGLEERSEQICHHKWE